MELYPLEINIFLMDFISRIVENVVYTEVNSYDPQRNVFYYI